MSALSERLSTLAPNHRAALEWFLDRRGQVVQGIPKRVNEIALLNAQTGIQKPKQLVHALSVKQTLSGGYSNVPPYRRPDGSWLYQYALQGADAYNTQDSTNNALIRCAADNIPVAVVIQTRAKNPARYEVLGLGRVVGWDASSVRLEGYNDAGEVSTLDSISFLPREFEPITPGDWRKKITAEIAIRQGGKEFRDGALADFQNRCPLSGYSEPRVLEAAHIVPYRGVQTNKRDNALLLRADLHILFDREVIWIDPDHLEVRIVKPIKGEHYSALDGLKLSLPSTVDAVTLGKRLSERDDFLTAKKSEKAQSSKAEHQT